MADTHKKVGIIGTGSFLPEKILTNADLQKMVDTNDEWIQQRTGIVQRRVADSSLATSDLAVEAARRALKDAHLEPKDLDMIILGTVTPDHVTPSTACYVQNKLGTRFIPAFDVSAACCGFLYAVSVGTKFIEAGGCKTVLAIGAETLTRITDYTDRGTCILFGDGAGAVILRAQDTGHEILFSSMASDGSGADLMIIPAGSSKIPATVKTVEDHLHFLKIKGREVYKTAVLKIVEEVTGALAQCNLTLDDLKMVIPHQMNLRIIEAAAERLGVSMDRFFVNIDKYGNTSSATIPIALDEAARSGRLKKGDIVILVAFGGGLTWASVVIRW
jgi:3-oxoacyl-[acyl-carrier-protein] synthase III